MSSKDAALHAGPSLLQLPPEVRNMIYKYLFDRVETKISWTGRNAHIGTDSGIIRWEDPALRHILATCRVVRAEAFPVLYRRVRFLIRILQRDPRFGIADFIKNVGHDAAQSITTLSLDRSLLTTPRRFNIALSTIPDPFDLCNNTLELIVGWVGHFPNLKELRLVYFGFKEPQLTTLRKPKKSLSRQALLLTRLMVLIEVKLALSFDRRNKRSISDVPLSYRLVLDGDSLFLERYDDQSSVPYGRC
ncbi:hypothetical protein XANCAGTX0491_004706 [Xanthoria calcicola]